MVKRCPSCSALLKNKHISDGKCWKCGAAFNLEPNEKKINKDKDIKKGVRHMNFGEAIQSGLKNAVKFDGRSSRSEYNYWLLFTWLITIFTWLLDPPDFYSGKGSTLGNIVSVALLLPGIALAIRRLHDTNKSGWFMLLSLTCIGVFPLFYWSMFKAGDKEDNLYGPNPIITQKVSNNNPKDENEIISNNLNVEEELRKFKKMLDSGLIEQEDYDAKKKELLGL
tara:strand:+ start:402 stop:1073 length:672 start_codon:yes stop_codon:yes gene_type:complete